MRRREFIALLGSAAVAWPRAARAQQSGKMHQLGYISINQTNQIQHLVDALRAGLQEHGWIEGRNFAFDFRWAEGRSDRVPALAADLVRAKVDIIIVASSSAAKAASSTTTSIPIVMAASTDALAEGLVVSLARPGGNLTGLTTLARDLVGKQLEILEELVPSLSQVTLLVNPTNIGQSPIVQEAEAGSRELGLQLHIFRAGEPGELQGVFEAMSREGSQGLVVMADAMFFGNRARIAELATGAGVPTVAPFVEHAMAGTLAAYGPNLPDMFRRAAVYIDKILKGAKPADLPVEQPTKFDLTINLKTAKALGLTVPLSLLARADEVIE
jgi:putative tryptophan/tyrosine transport system substrate-binding protein